MAPDPWPGTPGGASSPYWGGDIRLYVWAGILAGSTMRWGQSETDNLDAGNVWGQGATLRSGPNPPTGRLWVDLSCDVLSVETNVGGQRADGAIARTEAGTCTIRLADPDRTYDPTNPDSPYHYGAQTRLTPGTTIVVFVEHWDGTDIAQYRLFTGTVDIWGEDWELRPIERVAMIVASDAVKNLVQLDYGEQPSIGAGETVDARIARILTYYGWTGSKALDPSTNTLQATTLAQSAWELIGRATEDEIGFTYVDPMGVIQFRNRAAWTSVPDPVITIGCAPGETTYDMMTSASGQAASMDIMNAVFASVVGGTMQSARNQSSIDRYGLQSYKRTDLGLQTDLQAGTWASFLVQLRSTPRPQLQSLTVLPAFVPTVWRALLGLRLIEDRIRILWTPPDMTTPTEVVGRVLGVTHTVTHRRWEVGVPLVFADIFSSIMRWGPHTTDRLTAGNVYR